MTTENEWVKLPEPLPKFLPKGTQFKNDWGGSHWEFTQDVSLTGAYYPGEVVRKSDGHKLVGNNIAEMDGREWKLPTDYHFEGSAVVFLGVDGVRHRYAADQADDLGDTPSHLRELLGAAREGYADTVVFELGATPTVIRYEGSDLVGWHLEYQNALSEWRNGESWLCVDDADEDRRRLRRSIEQGRCYPTADARRIGMEEFGMVFDGDPGTLRHTLASEEPHQACACGATTNLRDVVTQRKERRSQPTLTVYVTRCGACEQERRRAEVRADLDRKLPAKKPEKSLAPPTWPDGAGDDYEL